MERAGLEVEAAALERVEDRVADVEEARPGAQQRQ